MSGFRPIPLTLALLLGVASPAAAQLTPGDLPFRFAEVVGGCPATATLEAVGGGGRVELRQGAEIRLPYGVPYRFRHQLPRGTDFALVTLDVTGIDPQRVGFQAAADDACIDVILPPLPMDRGVTLTETRGVAPSAEQLAAMLGAVDALRDAFFRKLYAGEFGRAIGEGRLPAAIAAEFPTMLPEEALRGFAVLRGDPPAPTPVLEIVRVQFTTAVGRIAAAPHDIQAGADLAGEISQILAGTPVCPALGALTPQQQTRLRSLEQRLQRLRLVTPPEGLGPLYENVLPVPLEEAEVLRSALTAACPDFPAETLTEHAATVAALARDDFGPIMAAIREARRLVQESFRLTATESFPGATTTLQRFGQLDVVNAFFFGREEVRLLATFSFYPGALRFGGEIQPHNAADRLVINLGYSLVTPVGGNGTGGNGTEESGDANDAVFALGAGLRLNQFFSLGAGRWLGGSDGGWYASFSGDVGAIPFLRELFARAPATPR